MTHTSSEPQVNGWLARNAVTIVLVIVSGSVSFVMGQQRGDATQDAKIQSLESQVSNKISREEFAQFTKSVEIQLQLINENLMAIRRERGKL